MTDATTLANAILKAHKSRRTREAVETAPAERLLIPTGSTMLNLALSDSIAGAIPCGKIISVPGDSSSGKSLLAMHFFAEMSADPRFDEWELIHDDTEAANEFDIVKLFGAKTAARIRPAAVDGDGNPSPSDTMEDFMLNVVRVARSGKPFLYVLDSLDAVVSKEELEILNAKVDGEKAKGSMGMQKAKQMGELMRLCVREIKKSNGVLIIVSQTRDNTNPAAHGGKTYSGGRAILFYSSAQIWTRVAGEIRTTDKRHCLGVTCEYNVKKNRFTGKRRTGQFPIYYSLGIDDVGSCVDWLVEEGWWPQKGNSINTIGMDGVGVLRTKIIKTIEDYSWEPQLRALVGQCWAKQEERLSMPDRKRRYQ